MTTLFKDRRDAGRFLATKLEGFADREDAIILALPRGGVPVGYEIALALHLALDVFVVRKLGAPFHEELALGAIATGGIRVLNQSLIDRLGISRRMIESIAAGQQKELERRDELYRAGRAPLDVSGKAVILVDDGLATGASMRAAVEAVRFRQPRFLAIAVPVGDQETCREFEQQVDRIVCGRAPGELGAVGNWYEDFTQTTDEEVAQLLTHLGQQRRAEKALESNPGS